MPSRPWDLDAAPLNWSSGSCRKFIKAVSKLALPFVAWDPKRASCRPRIHTAEDVVISRFIHHLGYPNSAMAEAPQIQSRLNEGRSPHCCFEYTRQPPAACPSRISQKADKFPPCYIITMAGISTLVGSGATAILSSVYWNDVAGGFAIGQYILGAGAIAITCVLQIHGKTCACWTK